MNKYKCDVCGKEEKRECVIFYSTKQFYLCWGHYLKWCKYHKPYSEEHKEINPLTKSWKKMCKEEERLFIKWLKKVRETEGSGND